MKLRQMLLSLVLLFSCTVTAQTILDKMESLQGWIPGSSADVTLHTSVAGIDNGKCIKLDIDCATTTGFVSLSKEISMVLPINFAFGFQIMGSFAEVPMEFQLTNGMGTFNATYSAEKMSGGSTWLPVIMKQQQFTGLEMQADTRGASSAPDRVTFRFFPRAVGKCVIYLKELTLGERTVSAASVYNPVAFASSSVKGNEVLKVFDKSLKTAWRSAGRQQREHILIDLRETSQFGGLKIAWDSLAWAKEFTVSVSDNANTWREVYSVKNGNGNISFIPIEGGEGRYIKLNLTKSVARNVYSIKEIGILPPAFSTGVIQLYKEISRMYPAGYYPKYFSGVPVQSRSFALPNSGVHAAISESGSVESESWPFSIEPMIYHDKQLLTVHNAAIYAFEEPVPAVSPMTKLVWQNMEMHIAAFPDFSADSAIVHIMYTIKNTGKKNTTASFFIAMRPFGSIFQSPAGGAVHFAAISPVTAQVSTDMMLWNEAHAIYLQKKADGAGAAEFDAGDMCMFARTDSLPVDQRITDMHGMPSAAVKYRITIKPGESRVLYCSIPALGTGLPLKGASEGMPADSYYQKEMRRFCKPAVNKEAEQGKQIQ